MRDTDWRPSPCPTCGRLRAASEHPVCLHCADLSKPEMPDRALRAGVIKGLSVSAAMVRAAQNSYEANPEYGLTNEDMKKAIQAALRAAYKGIKK